MAIAFDNAVDGTSGSPSLSWSHSCSGTNRLLIVAVKLGGGNPLSSVTCNGVAMTQIASPVTVNDYSAKVYLFYTLNPNSGSNTIVASTGDGSTISGISASYTGVKQTGQPNSSDFGTQASGNPITDTLTSTLDNCWHMAVFVDGTVSAGTNTTQRVTGGGGIFGLYDGNGSIHPAGSNSISANVNGSFGSGKIGVIFSPDIPVQLSATDTSVVTDSSLVIQKSNIQISDTTAVTESVTITIFSSSDLPATLNVSGYKWLTSSLFSAQQGYALRPYFNCKIVDDSIKSTGIASNIGNPYQNGSAAPTPDGNIVAAGFDSSNHIVFWKGRNLAAGSWDSSTTLDTSSGVVSTQALAINQVAIAVSDYYKGRYRIDVAYLTNFDNSLSAYFGSYLGLVVWSSDDGGTTWYNQMPGVGTYGYTTDLVRTNYITTSAYNLYLALMKPRLVNGVMTSGVIYLAPSGHTMPSGYMSYALKYAISPFPYTSTNTLTPTAWDGHVESFDWTISSFDTYYFNGVDYIIFAAFRNVLDAANTKSTNQVPNYSLWITAILRRSNSTTPQLWLPPTPLISTGSAVVSNQNIYLFPKASVQNGCVDLLVQAGYVVSIAPGSTGFAGTTNKQVCALLRSTDGFNFSYPQILVDSNGNAITFNPNFFQTSFVAQDNYYYLISSGLVTPANSLYQFVKNNTVADISADVIGYTIQENAGQPSSITLQVANQNNQWYGTSPTQPGAAAIVRNAKIVLWQGYYDATGTPQAVPRNIFFIDDITQKITGTDNDLTITGRDLHKQLMVLTTRYTLQWVGPLLYLDGFYGDTLGNWNQQSGSWIQGSNSLYPSSVVSGDMVITLGSVSQIPQSSIITVNVQMPGRTVGGANNGSFIYAFYIDANNWLRLRMWEDAAGSNTNAEIEYCINGIFTGGSTLIGITTWSSNQYLSFFIRQYDYYKWTFLVGSTTSFAANTNPLTAWSNAQIIGNVDLTSNFANTTSLQSPYVVGVGENNYQYAFQLFRYIQFAPQADILNLTKSLAAKAEIFKIKPVNLFDEPLTLPSLSGSYSIQNRKIIIPPSGSVLDTNVNNVIGNGEIVFTAKVTPLQIASGQQFGLAVLFRTSGNTSGVPTQAYLFRAWQYDSTTGLSTCRFERVISAANYVFPNTAADAGSNPGYNSLNLDLTQYHTYKITFFDGWMYAYIDDIMVAAWLDNNTDFNYLTSGQWGFQSHNSNSTVTVKDISSPNFYKPMQSFSFNPGDDASNSLTNLLQSVRGWFFSDLLGRMKLKLLSSSDISNYTYNSQLWSQNVDQSDKEYISRVTVYGSNVMATAENASLDSGRATRDAVIVDYGIVSLSDAQARANQELINYNQYLNQLEPTQAMNVGSEILDAITVINTGNNTSNVNSVTRVYSQSFSEGGGTNKSDYSIQIQTGNL